MSSSDSALHLLALGANSAASMAANARSIARAVGVLPGRAIGWSRFFRTPAWPPGNGPDFVNAVVLLRTPLSPPRLLERLHAIEARAGRVRGARWGARVLDIDLLGSGRRVRPDPATQVAWMKLPSEQQAREAPEGLILPHPRLQDRAFVLVPLVEVAPAWRHPVTGRRVAEMASRLTASEMAKVRPIAMSVAGRRGVVNPKRRS